MASRSSSNGWLARDASEPSARASGPSVSLAKGKNRARDDDEEEVWDDVEPEDGDDGASFQDYQSAMDAALHDDDDEGGQEDGFVYDGVDDEDMQQLRREAKEGEEGYDEKLRGILGDEVPEGIVPDPDPPERHEPPDMVKVGDDRTFSQPPTPTLSRPRSPLSGPSTTKSPNRDGNGNSIAGSSPPSSIVHFPHPPRLPSSASVGTLYAGPPAPRRPPMNPLVSRLRSTSGVPSLAQSASYRSFFNSSTLPDLNGFANGSPNSSFMGDLPRRADRSGMASRQSSMSNFQEYLGVRGADGRITRQISPSPSELFNSPQTGPSSAPSVRNAPTPPMVSPFRWTKLRKISYRIMPPSASSKNTNNTSTSVLGEPTAMAASGIICIGTSKGWTMVFEYSQTLRGVCGNDNIVKAAGRVTALAISSDQTFVAVGHKAGHIYLYDLKKPSQPARTVLPTSLSLVEAGKAEGHLERRSSIVHLDFVGERHTAIVSGDSLGLAFYHSLGKVLGLANTDVLRILGKYPQTAAATAQLPSTASGLLAMQPLPLGTAAHPSEDYSLVALLTRAKLVVAGLKPAPRTWWRCMNRDGPSSKTEGKEEVDDYKGCIAWLPAIDGKSPSLAFSWGRRLHIVSVDQETKRVPQPRANGRSSSQSQLQGDKRASTLRFLSVDAGQQAKPADEEPPHVYEADQPICALQWLNQRTLVILTANHIEAFDVTLLRRTEAATLESQDLTFPSFVPPYQALKSYKSKLFLFPAAGLCAGSLLSWADRVLQLVDAGELVSAIELVIAYYEGPAALVPGTTAVNVNLGLPSEDAARKAIVEPKLREILTASMHYVFSEDRMKDDTHSDPEGRGVDRTSLFESLVDAVIRASVALDTFDFLFEDLYERYTSDGIEGIFLDRLEPFILQKTVQDVPTGIVQQLLRRHEERDELQQAEDLIWHVKPEYLDVNQAASLCSRHGLYDALIYVYTQALGDFVGPLVELMGLIRQIGRQRRLRPRWNTDEDSSIHFDESFASSSYNAEDLVSNAYKAYAYLADSLMGLSHPSKEALPNKLGLVARKSLYDFLLSKSSRYYPQGTRKLVETADEDGAQEPDYPYFRLLLRFDSEAMLDCLDLVFEDPFLDDIEGERYSENFPSRQNIVDLVLKLLSTSRPDEFTSTDKTFCNIFIARNLPKYAQFVRLSPDTSDNILRNLIDDSDLSTREDRQLAAEYLLSAHTPEYDDELLRSLDEAGFFRILASYYTSRRRWRQLASVYIRDPDQGFSVYEHLRTILRSTKGKTEREGVEQEILEAIPSLVDYSVSEAAYLVENCMPDRHTEALAALEAQPLRRMAYLRSLLEPDLAVEHDVQSAPDTKLSQAARLLYVTLLCKHDSEKIVRYLRKDTKINRHAAADICRKNNVYEAVIWIQAHEDGIEHGLRTMDDVIKARSELILASAYSGNDEAEMSSNQMVKAAHMGITVCSEYSSEGSRTPAETDTAWFILVSSLVELIRDVSASQAVTPNLPTEQYEAIRTLLPEALGSMMSASPSSTASLPRLVRQLMGQASSATYAEYRIIIDNMLDTYRFEGDLLVTSNKLLKADLFEHVADLAKEKSTGWRPNVSGRCEACGQSIWPPAQETSRFSDPGLVAKSSSALEVKEKMKGRPSVKRRPSLKGKETDWYEEPVPRTQRQDGQAIVVFRGGAACHARCLEQGGKF